MSLISNTWRLLNGIKVLLIYFGSLNLIKSFSIGDIVAKRFFNIFLQNEWIFKLTPLYRKQRKYLKILHDFTDKVIVTRRDELLNNLCNVEASQHSRFAFLDILLQSSVNGKPLTNMDIREEVDTFLFEGHDTTSSGISFCLYNLAKYPEIQQKLYKEITKVIGNDVDKSTTQKDLNELHYLDMVIKESLRLYPPIPLFGRDIQEDITISKQT